MVVITPIETEPQWNYSVFISFRGEDTRKTFVDHLYVALNGAGIHTFKDDEKLEKGNEIPTQLLKAIEESKISVIVLSKNYASSSFCLKELVKILECKEILGQKVLPIFYDVDPSNVRKQKESFGQDLAQHEQNGTRIEDVRSWREALTAVANLSGYDSRHFANGCEAKLIQKIVQDISNKFNRSHVALNVCLNPVGINSRVDKVISLLDVGGLDDIRIIGIWGVGGIGKTTIAKAVFNRVAEQFEGYIFLKNVRENSEKHGGLHLQRELLAGILRLKETDLEIINDDRGVNVIKERLHNNKVLIVLDDVDSQDQLEKLAGAPNWFGSGSRIIITTRDSHLGKEVYGTKDYMTYRVEELNYNEALQLFCWKQKMSF